MMRRERWIMLLRASVWCVPLGVACGLVSALFLWLLQRVTQFRSSHSAWVYALPFAGLVLGSVYERLEHNGNNGKSGNNAVIETIYDLGAALPARALPLALVGALITHWFGGSAGREGTAVQMGANLAERFAQRLRLSPDLRRIALAAGVAGGFGSVFGTPVAGAIFGLELAGLGRIPYVALVPALITSLVGDITTRALGISHTHYLAPARVPLSALLLAKWLAFAVAVSLVSIAFIELSHLCKSRFERHLPRLPWRLAAGGLAVVVLWRTVGTDDYLGLSLPLLDRAFHDTNLPLSAFALKLLFTIITLGAGFLGGEVTPLFVMGATLGNWLARLLHIPLELGAGVGLAAVFAAAANTPLALTVMAAELLGAAIFPHAAYVCLIAYLLTGKRSIYTSQRLANKPSLQLWRRKI